VADGERRGTAAASLEQRTSLHGRRRGPGLRARRAGAVIAATALVILAATSAGAAATGRPAGSPSRQPRVRIAALVRRAGAAGRHLALAARREAGIELADEVADTATPTVPATPTPAPAAPVTPAPATPAGSSVYWGAWIGSQLTGTDAPWDPRAITDFAQLAGKSPSIVEFSSPFAECSSSCSPDAFDPNPFNLVHEAGAIPLFSWGSQADQTNDNQSPYGLSAIINGSLDSYITTWATAARNWGHPFFLRFDWEMNGNWFPWSPGVDGNTSAEYVEAWQHIHNIFTAVGATNVAWVWCPNIDPYNKFTSLASLYPGDAYVNWTCMDVYNQDNPWTSFQDLAQPTYNEITQQVAPSKPMIIAETSSTESGGSKAQWIDDLFTALPTDFPRIDGLVWMEQYVSGDGSPSDWPIETSSSATAAFAAGIASSRYASNSFGSLAGLQPVTALGSG
jgi:hypothetical protein